LKKLVTFDVASPFAFFRKNFTTTNALTFAVIPRSAVEGLIGSIIGLSKSDFPAILKDSKIAVELKSTVRKLNMKYMHINKDWWNETLNRYLNGRQFILQKIRAQIAVPASVEFLVNPAYRIYVDCCNEEINDKLSESLRNKQSYYTPCLGGSSMIASLKHVGEFDYEAVNGNGDFLPVSSIISFNGHMPKIKLEKNTRFATEEDLARHIDNERRSEGTYSAVYSVEPQKVMVSGKDTVKVKNGKEDVYIKFI
jgi:CRISPR-associated protein Cas5h